MTHNRTADTNHGLATVPHRDQGSMWVNTSALLSRNSLISISSRQSPEKPGEAQSSGSGRWELLWVTKYVVTSSVIALPSISPVLRKSIPTLLKCNQLVLKQHGINYPKIQRCMKVNPTKFTSCTMTSFLRTHVHKHLMLRKVLLVRVKNPFSVREISFPCNNSFPPWQWTFIDNLWYSVSVLTALDKLTTCVRSGLHCKDWNKHQTLVLKEATQVFCGVVLCQKFRKSAI